ncbi:MAG: FAD-binding protein [Candidatus Thermoplasmatota archaeon]|nr:FAD-binding protein [Candidatus Thermoplasmatota archaeon]
MNSEPDFTTIKVDVLIIGAGGAGLRAAIEARSLGASVAILSKSLLGKAHTVMAEGGIAASLGNVDNKDNWKVHFADTYVEGVFLGNYRMSEILAKEAPDRVYELERYGALFDRTPGGLISQRAFGAHTYRRLCHVGDKTGLELIRTVQEKSVSSGAKVYDELVISKIFNKNGRAIGALALSMREGKFYVFSAKAVIVATGGLGRIYKVTSNSWESTGDGHSLAVRAGAELMDMEMVQFHPTGMVYPPAVRGLLVTEGVRGDGGILLNNKGERYMLKYSPKKKELDARDIVARANYNEIIEGRGSEHGGVYLDISYKGKKFIMEKLPSMYMQYKEFAGIDITKEKMEVAPTTHYHMGGIRVDPDTTQTRVEGLYAAGEVASGLHGANRLGGNSLADILVFGRRAGKYAAEYALKSTYLDVDEVEVKDEIKRVSSYLKSGEKQNPYDLIEKLRTTMSEKVGIIREEKHLKEALDIIREIKSKSGTVGVPGGLRFNPGLIACLELDNMLLSAELLVNSAIERRESRGAHARKDYPDRSKEFMKNFIYEYDGNKISMTTAPVPKLPAELEELIPKEEVIG